MGKINILSDVEVSKLNHVGIDQFSLGTVEMRGEVISTDPSINYGFIDNYSLRLRVGVNFSCVDKDYDEALKNAKRQLSYFMHSGVLRELLHIKSLVYSGDKVSSIERINKLMEELELE